MNTVGAAAFSAGAHMDIRLYTYIMLYYIYIYTLCVHTYCVCISVKSTIVRTTPHNQHVNNKMRSIILQKTFCIDIQSLKWIVFNHSGTTAATRGCGGVSHIFCGVLISMFVFDILLIPRECPHFHTSD